MQDFRFLETPMDRVSKARGARTGPFTPFARDERGNIAIMFGMMVGVCAILIGASVDIGRWMLARKQTQEASDAAVLAGLRQYQATGDATSAVALAQANYIYSVMQSKRGTPSTNGLLVSDNISFVLQNNNTSMAAVGDAYIKTPFLGIVPKILNLQQLPLLKTNGTENAIATLAVGKNANTNLEVSIMIDITGSMGQSDNAGSTKIQTVKDAAAALVDILVWQDQSQFTSKIAVVPFSETVNLGTPALANAARGYLNGGSSNSPGSQEYTFTNPCNSGGGNGYGYGNCGTAQTLEASNTCVTERTGSNRYTDVSPTTSPVGRYYSPYGSYNGSGYCPTQTAVIPLSSDKTALKTTINSLTAGGGTAGQTGTAWAWYMLSPNFGTLWPASTPRPYSDLTALNSKGQPVLKKIAILMTDGDYNTSYCNGVPTYDPSNTGGVPGMIPTTCGAYNDSSQNQAGSLCTAMKAKGIEVYTIGAQVSASAKAFLQTCATDTAHYYDATDGAKLKQAFIDIAYKLVPPFVSH
jgi:Flp pilus assembly protein TadG